MPSPSRPETMGQKRPKEGGEAALSDQHSSHNELLWDSLATLSRVASFLNESLGLQVPDRKQTRPSSLAIPFFAGSTDIAEFVRDTQREVQDLQDDIGAISTLPCPRRQTAPSPRLRS